MINMFFHDTLIVMKLHDIFFNGMLIVYFKLFGNIFPKTYMSQYLSVLNVSYASMGTFLIISKIENVWLILAALVHMAYILARMRVFVFF